MIASTNAINLIKDSESVSLVPYNCPAGHATIGYGHLLHRGPVTADDERVTWSLEHAENVLKLDITVIERELNKKIKVPVNQNQFDALVSWTFNLGIGRLVENKCSWLMELNKENYSAVPELLKRWNKATVNGVMVELPGLTKRRVKEAELFSKPYPGDNV
jgi:lysozyme